MQLFKQLRKNWPLLVLTVLWAVLVWQNYAPGTWLMGWDSLHPEFDFGLNIKRNLAGAWQENWGLGSATGMGMIADLPRQILLWAVSWVLPSSTLRYAYHFAMLLLGPLGMFLLLKKVFGQTKTGEQFPFLAEVAAFLGAGFYLLNLGTLQNFYAPFEAFTTHHGFLPWLFWAVLRVLEDFGRRNLAILATLSFLSAPMAVTPTIWLVWLGALGVFLAASVLGEDKPRNYKTPLVVSAVVLLTNLFWLLPFAHYGFTSGSRVADSKISQMSSEESYLLNRKYGRIRDVAISRGFWFDNVDRQESGSYEYMFLPWREHLRKPGVMAMGYGIFGVVLLGILGCLGNLGEARLKYRGGFLALFALSILPLFNSNPPLGFVFEFLRQHWGLFAEVMRFPYTKFSVLAIMGYSVFLTGGIGLVFGFIQKVISKREIRGIGVIRVIGAMGGIGLIGLAYFMQPAFQGNLIYSKLQVEVPVEYFELMDYLQTQPADKRILALPLHTFWSWRYHSWGYRGSGFLWQGIKQPILDRAFDAWSPYNEAAYQEFSTALIAQNWAELEGLLNKYQISLILWDKSVVGAEENRPPQAALINLFLANSSKVQARQTFGQLALFEVQLGKPQILSFGSSVALQYQGEKENQLVFSLEADDLPHPAFLQTQAFTQTESQVWVEVSLRQDPASKETWVKLHPLIPQIYQEQEILGVALADVEFTLDNPSRLNQFYLAINNNLPWMVQDLASDYQYLGQAVLDLSLTCQAFTPDGCKNYLRVFSGQSQTSLDLTQRFSAQSIQNCSLVKEGQKLAKTVQADGLELEAQDAKACLYFELRDFPKQAELVNFNLEYYSETSVVPGFCLWQEQSQGCLNTSLPAQKNQLRFGEWGLYQSWVQLPPREENESLWPHFYLNAEDLVEPQKISLRHVRLDSYSLLVEHELQLDELLTDPASSAQAKIQVAPIQLEQLQIRWPQPKSDGAAGSWLSFDKNSLAKKARNCDSFNSGQVQRQLVELGGSKYAIEYQALDTTACEEFVFPSLSHRQGYLLEINQRHLTGLPLNICLTAGSQEECLLTAKLTESLTNTFWVPAINDEGWGYSLIVNNPSIGRVPSINQLLSIKFTSLPYWWLKNIGLSQAPDALDSNSFLLSNQAYDSGWLALALSREPRFVKILTHELVNGWANGWRLTKQKAQLIVFYWPQALEWLGISVLAGLTYGLTAETIGAKIARARVKFSKKNL